MPPEKKDAAPSSISVQTLLISSLSAVAAAVVVPMFWERGSLIATAITPVVVALTSEALNRPAKVIKTTSPHRRVRRVPSERPVAIGARESEPPRPRETRWGDGEDPFGLRTQPRKRRFPWKLGVITGLLAAVIGAGVVTASELAVFGHSVGHSNRTTSVFGGKEHKSKATPTPTATETATPSEDATEAPTQTATPQATETATATATATATPQTQVAPTATAPTTTVTPAPTP